MFINVTRSWFLVIAWLHVTDIGLHIRCNIGLHAGWMVCSFCGAQLGGFGSDESQMIGNSHFKALACPMGAASMARRDERRAVREAPASA